MHKPTRASVLPALAMLLILTNPCPGALAAELPSRVRTSIPSVDKPSEPSTPVGYEYRVKPTDTLWDIAVTHGITVDALIAANRLANPRLLRPGQTLWVPAAPPAIAKPSSGVALTEDSPVPTEGPDVSTLPPGKESWPEELLSLINESRSRAGLPPLTWSAELGRAAQAHAQDLARRNQGGHVGSDGAQLKTRVAREGVATRWASENWANAQSVQGAFALWWNEMPGRDPHRRNILDPRYTVIGIGVASGKWGTYFVADFAGL